MTESLFGSLVGLGDPSLAGAAKPISLGRDRLQDPARVSFGPGFRAAGDDPPVFEERVFPVGSARLRVLPCSVPQADDLPSGLWRWRGSLGDHPFTAWLSSGGLEAAARHAGLHLPPGRLDSRILTAAAEWLAGHVLGSACILSEGQPEPNPDSLAAEARCAFHLTDCAATLALSLSLPLRARLDQILADWPRATFSQPLIATCCLIGFADLSLEDLESLEPGDVVELDGPGWVPEEAWLVAAGSHIARVDLSVSPAKMASILARPSRFSREKELLMDHSAPPEQPAEPLDATLASLPVRLVFEAGRASLPLSALQSLVPGSLAPLDGPLGTVDILSGGHRIGIGEIVVLEGARYVRIHRIFR